MTETQGQNFAFPENRKNGLYVDNPLERQAATLGPAGVSQALLPPALGPLFGTRVLPPREGEGAGSESPFNPAQGTLDELHRRVAELHTQSQALLQTVMAPRVERRVQPSGPIVLFEQIMTDWGFNEQEAAAVLGFETPSAVRDLYRGLTSLRQRDSKDRLRAIISMASDLDSLYRDPNVIRDWLRERQAALGSESPFNLLTEGSMSNVLRVQQFVEYLSGK